MVRFARFLISGAAAWLLTTALFATPAIADNVLPQLLVSDTDADAVKLFDPTQSDPSLRYQGIFTKNAAGTAPDSGLIRPFGMTFGANGNLYVASLGTAQIREYNGTTGNFVRVVASGVGLVNSLAVAPDGSLLYSSYNQTVNGAAVGAIDRVDLNTGTISVLASGNGMQFPTGITVDPVNGDLFVASSRTQNSTTGSIYQYNSLTGAFKGVFVSPVSGGLVAPAQIDFGPANPFNSSALPELYVTSFFGSNANAVTRFDSNGAFSGIAASGSGIVNPGGVQYGEDGILYVSAYGNKAIYRFNPLTGANLDGGKAWITSNATNGLTGPTYLLYRPGTIGGAGTLVPVPEPGSYALLGLGSLVLLGVRRFRTGRSA